MNILYDPCCLGAIALLVIYGIGKFVAAVVAEYRRDRDESKLKQGRQAKEF